MKTNFFRTALSISMIAIASITFYSCEQDALEGISSEVLQEKSFDEKHNENFVELSEDEYIEGQLYVKLKDDYNKNFKSSSPKVDLNKLPFLNDLKRNSSFNVKSTFYFAKSSKLNRTLRVYLDNPEQTDALIAELESSKEVEYVERVPLARTSLTPNDLGANTVSEQWGLHKIQAQEAWEITQGSPNVVVAVVDDAIMTTHPDLAGQTVAGRDVSDDDNDTNPSTNLQHGTHVAGIVGAATNNGTGIASIGYNVKIMPIKATPDSGIPGYVYNGYEGITWAADNGADVINMSWGGSTYSQTNANVISAAAAQGVVLVASAGNSNSSVTKYPAGYPNVISVANTDINDNKSSTSSYGPTVDVSAPGTSIRSTVISGDYANWSGTSMAAPMVAGLCGLVLSVDPTLSIAEVENCIKSTTDPISSYAGSLGTGRINALKAVQCAAGNNGTCTTPSPSEITYTEHSSIIYLYAYPYQGDAHQFRYRLDGGSWQYFNETTSHYNTVSNKQCGIYEIQLRQKCNGTWSSWSSVKTIVTTVSCCTTPSPTEITYTEHSSLVYLYAYPYQGDAHQFRYRFNNGGWKYFSPTSSHYNTISNKQCGTYKVQLRQKCSNAWTGWSTVKSIVTCQ